MLAGSSEKKKKERKQRKRESASLLDPLHPHWPNKAMARTKQTERAKTEKNREKKPTNKPEKQLPPSPATPSISKEELIAATAEHLIRTNWLSSPQPNAAAVAAEEEPLKKGRRTLVVSPDGRKKIKKFAATAFGVWLFLDPANHDHILHVSNALLKALDMPDADPGQVIIRCFASVFFFSFFTCFFYVFFF